MHDTIRITARMHERAIHAIVTAKGCDRPMLIGHYGGTGAVMTILVHGDPTAMERDALEADLEAAVGMTVEVVTDADFLGAGYQAVMRSAVPLVGDETTMSRHADMRGALAASGGADRGSIIARMMGALRRT